MAQRSPLNPRYQKYTKPSGKTRRSAASARPTRSAGKTTSASGSSAKRRAGARGSAARGAARQPVVMSPEYKKWRNIWWASLGVSLGLALLYLVARAKLPPQVQFGMLVGCYIFLGIGLLVDWRKVRPAREAALREAKSGKTSGSSG